MRKKAILLVALFTLIGSACVSPTAAPQEPTATSAQATKAPIVLTVMTHDSFSISEEVVADFEAEHNAQLQFLKIGDTGTAVSKAVLAKDNPLADVFYGIDNTFLSRALEEGIFESYSSPILAEIPEMFKLDPENRALPVDYGDVCLNYDVAFLNENAIDPPTSLEDLLDPIYKGLLVVQNPATSSPGLAFLLTTIGHFGEDDYLNFWRGLVDNDVLVVNDWETTYYGEFTRSGGTRPIVVSYGSSPPAEVYFSEEPLDEAPTAAVVDPETCFRQIEFVGILKGTQNRTLAEAWVDFMLSPTFQEDMPLHMFVFPVNPNAGLPDVFIEHAVIPDQPVQLSPESISNNRVSWIQAWTATVLR